MNRQKLKAQLIQERDRCDWCFFPLGDDTDMHEWLVKRNAVPKSKKNLIMDARNCSLLHTACHAEHGASREMQIKLAPTFVERYGKQAMYDFIESLDLKSPHQYISIVHHCRTFYF